MKKQNRLNGKTIEIGGLLYKVKYVNKKPVKNSKELMVRGEIDFGTRIIEIEKGLSPSEEIAVIVHELCHGVLDTILPAKILDDYSEIEEMIVDPFSRLLVSALRSAKFLNE